MQIPPKSKLGLFPAFHITVNQQSTFCITDISCEIIRGRKNLHSEECQTRIETGDHWQKASSNKKEEEDRINDTLEVRDALLQCSAPDHQP